MARAVPPFWLSGVSIPGPSAFASHAIPRLIYFYRLYFTTFPGPLPKPQHLNTHASEPKLPPIRDAGHGVSGSRTEPTSETDSQALYYYFTLDDDLFYLSFYQDWGPLNMAMVYRACILMHELLEVGVAFRSFVGIKRGLYAMFVGRIRN